MRRKKTNFHSNGAFPNLINQTMVVDPRIQSYYLTPKHKTIINYLKTGACLFLDIKEKKVLLYEASLHILKTLSIRTLSFLIKKGLVKVEFREGERVHFILNN